MKHNTLLFLLSTLLCFVGCQSTPPPVPVPVPDPIEESEEGEETVRFIDPITWSEIVRQVATDLRKNNGVLTRTWEPWLSDAQKTAIREDAERLVQNWVGE